MNYRCTSIRIKKILHDELFYIARSYGRSGNGQVLYLIRQEIERFEKEHGKIDGPANFQGGRRNDPYWYRSDLRAAKGAGNEVDPVSRSSTVEKSFYEGFIKHTSELVVRSWKAKRWHAPSRGVEWYHHAASKRLHCIAGRCFGLRKRSSVSPFPLGETCCESIPYPPSVERMVLNCLRSSAVETSSCEGFKAIRRHARRMAARL